jgi:hypothetical protein
MMEQCMLRHNTGDRTDAQCASECDGVPANGLPFSCHERVLRHLQKGTISREAVVWNGGVSGTSGGWHYQAV